MRRIWLIFFTLVNLAVYGQNLDVSYHPMYDSTLKPFFHGVAAGDSRATSFVIWTRVTPRDTVDSIHVRWFVAVDTDKRQIIRQGAGFALRDNDYTVKILVDSLMPWTKYAYWFETCDSQAVSNCRFSDTGHVKTTPADTQFVRNINFAVFTGSNYNAGYFNAYCAAARNHEIDFAIHTGDYIYEYGNFTYGKNPFRWLEPNKECVTLRDYRMRYSHYRLDSCLRKAHQAFGWYTIWDDHEVANDSWWGGAQNHQRKEGNYFVRRSNAFKAYFEWIPIRNNKDTSVIRAFSLGQLAYMIFLDTRHHHRDYQRLDVSDTNKTMLGKDQLNWLFSQLLYAQSKAYRWIIVVQQLMFSPLLVNHKIVNYDGWDSYPYERRKILRFIYEHNMKNVIFVGGDLHTSWINGLYLNPENYNGRQHDTLVSFEFITPSITSPSTNWIMTILAKFASKTAKYNYIRYVNLHRKGYMELSLYTDKIVAKYYYVRTILRPDVKVKLAKRYVYKGLIFNKNK